MEHIHHIRYEHNEKDKSLREIARETGHDRRTVKRYVDQVDFSAAAPLKRRRACKSDPYRETVRGWLKDDQSAPRKQHHTARRVFERLKQQEQDAEREFTLSDRSVRSLVADLKRELDQAPLPLSV